MTVSSTASPRLALNPGYQPGLPNMSWQRKWGVDRIVPLSCQCGCGAAQICCGGGGGGSAHRVVQPEFAGQLLGAVADQHDVRSLLHHLPSATWRLQHAAIGCGRDAKRARVILPAAIKTAVEACAPPGLRNLPGQRDHVAAVPA